MDKLGLTPEQLAACPTLRRCLEKSPAGLRYSDVPLDDQQEISHQLFDARGSGYMPTCSKCFMLRTSHAEHLALKLPRHIALRENLKAFPKSGDDEMEAAALASLQLYSPEPLYKTHSLVVFLKYNANQDVTVAFDLIDPQAMPNDRITPVLRTPLGLETAKDRDDFLESLTQEGLNKSYGMGHYPASAVRFLVFWCASNEDNTQHAFHRQPKAFAAFSSPELSKAHQASFTDINWKDSLARRLKVPGQNFMDPKAPAGTPREVARRTKEYC